jgi:hypothetical protein
VAENFQKEVGIMKSAKDTIATLEMITGAIIKCNETERMLKSIRQRLEKEVWQNRKANLNFELKIEELDLSNGAVNLIPGSVRTVGELCELRVVEIATGKNKYLMEIRDALRRLGLVLKPED